MTFEEYKSELYKLPFGKILPNAIYVYRSGAEVLGVKLHALVQKIELKYETDESFNLLKFRTDDLKISLLSHYAFLKGQQHRCFINQNASVYRRFFLL